MPPSESERDEESRSTTGGDASGSEPVPGRRRPEKPPRVLPHLSVDQLRCEVDSLGRKFFYMPNSNRAVCGRRLKAKNRTVENEACLGIPTRYGPCRVHGAGGGHPVQHGRYSRVLKKWGRGFSRALADEQMLDTRRELALMDALIEKLVKRAERGDTPTWREDIQRTYGELDAAIRGMRHTEVAQHMKALGALIEQGANHDTVRRDVLSEIDRRAHRAQKTAELELRREERMSIAEVGVLVGRFIEVLNRSLPTETMYRLVPQLRAALTDKGVTIDAPREIEAASDGD